MPAELPASFEFESFSARASLSYSLDARCHVEGFFEPDLRSRMHVTVKPAIPSAEGRKPGVFVVAKEVRPWRIFSVGSVDITGHLDKVRVEEVCYGACHIMHGSTKH